MRGSLIISVILWSINVSAQKHFFQPEMGWGLYYANNQKYNVQDEASFKFRPAEHFFIGFSYQRRINEFLFFKTGIYHTSISQRYAHTYRWHLTPTKYTDNNKVRDNLSFESMATIKMPVGLSLHMPLNKAKTHTLEAAIAITGAYIFFNISTYSSVYLNEDYSKETTTFFYSRETGFPLQAFADITFTYIHTTPKKRNWVFFFTYEPQITRNTIYTYVTLMPGSALEKTWVPDIYNHNVQFGVGYRFVSPRRQE